MEFTDRNHGLPLHLKPRIRWTKSLHEMFVEATNRLGGCDYATPKNIVAEMGVQGLTIRQVKSHLQNYRRQQKQSATKRQEEISIHDYGSSSIQTEVGTSQPVNPMQAAAGLGGQFVEPAITPCNGTQNWNSTLTPMPTYQGDTFSNPPFLQNELSLLVDEEMHLLISSAVEEQLSNSMMGVAGNTQERAPSLGSSTNPVLQIPEESTASDETFLDLDDWPS